MDDGRDRQRSRMRPANDEPVPWEELFMSIADLDLTPDESKKILNEHSIRVVHCPIDRSP